MGEKRKLAIRKCVGKGETVHKALTSGAVCSIVFCPIGHWMKHSLAMWFYLGPMQECKIGLVS